MCISGYVFQALLGHEKRKNLVRINHKVLLVKRYHKLLCTILFGRNLNVKHGRGSQTILAIMIGRVNVLDVMSQHLGTAAEGGFGKGQTMSLW